MNSWPRHLYSRDQSRCIVASRYHPMLTCPDYPKPGTACRRPSPWIRSSTEQDRCQALVQAPRQSRMNQAQNRIIQGKEYADSTGSRSDGGRRMSDVGRLQRLRYLTACVWHDLHVYTTVTFLTGSARWVGMAFDILMLQDEQLTFLPAAGLAFSPQGCIPAITCREMIMPL